MSNANGKSADSSAVTDYFDPRTTRHGLSREEDCMLKSALAYVLVRARQKKTVQDENRGRSNSSSPFNNVSNSDKEGRRGGKRHHREPNAITESLTSPLDRILCSGAAADVVGGFCQTPTSFGVGRDRGGRGGNAASSLNSTSIVSLTSSLLRRKGPESTTHLDKMFTTARSLAKAVMVRRQQAAAAGGGGGIAESGGDDGSAALIGATTHLAQQLKTLLLIEQEDEMKKNRFGQPENHGSRTPQTPSVVVFPEAVTGIKKRQRQRSTSPPPNSQSTTPSKSSRTAVTVQTTPTINNTNKDDKTVATTSATTDDRHTPTVVTASSWIFSSLKASSDIIDIRSSFFVYQTMIPYVGMNHPTLIGHIFVIASNMIRDLYDDRMSIRGSSNSTATATAATAGIGNGVHYKASSPDDTRMKIMSLNVLAVESLRLLESCWLADVPRDVEKEHRDFLLLTLQDKLGDLLVPLPLSDIACAYSRCSQKTATVVKHKRHQDRLQQQAAAAVAFEQERNNSCNATNKIGTELTPPTQKSYSNKKTTKNLTPSLRPTDRSKRPRKYQSPTPSSSTSTSNISSSQYLDPGAKLIMRLGVYKLLSV